MALPRLFVLMGSGETSPTMTKTHREVLTAVGPARSVLLDTPVGFQENADIVSRRAVEYFDESLQRSVEIASYRRADQRTRDALAYETAMTQVREAGWVFCGPGSPTYALEQWKASAVPDLFSAKLAPGGHGGAVVLSSAAVCTAGALSVPVYEIYKVGQDPFWVEGLDLLAVIGLRAAVIPHFDNTEGGNHDTRFCYLGERRLSALERQLEADGDEAFVLGIDEHTAAVLDLDAGALRVTGNGSVTVRVRGRSSSFSTGAVLSFDELRGVVDDLAAGSQADVVSPGPLRAPSWPGGTAGEGSAVGPGGPAALLASQQGVGPAGPAGLLNAQLEQGEAAFRDGLESRDSSGLVRAVLEIESALVDWSRDPTQSAELFAAMERGRALLRSLIVQLGDVAGKGLGDPREAVAPLVEALLRMRKAARSDGRWADSDMIRDELKAAGIEVRDTPNSTEWLLADG